MKILKAKTSSLPCCAVGLSDDKLTLVSQSKAEKQKGVGRHDRTKTRKTMRKTRILRIVSVEKVGLLGVFYKT